MTKLSSKATIPMIFKITGSLFHRRLRRSHSDELLVESRIIRRSAHVHTCVAATHGENLLCSGCWSYKSIKNCLAKEIHWSSPACDQWVELQWLRKTSSSQAGLTSEALLFQSGKVLTLYSHCRQGCWSLLWWCYETRASHSSVAWRSRGGWRTFKSLNSVYSPSSKFGTMWSRRRKIEQQNKIRRARRERHRASLRAFLQGLHLWRSTSEAKRSTGKAKCKTPESRMWTTLTRNLSILFWRETHQAPCPHRNILIWKL